MRSNTYQKVLHSLTALLGAGILVFLIVRWPSLPEQLPAHFDLNGQVDRWGGKGSLLFPAIAGYLLVGGMCLLEHFPQIWNTGVTVTEENRAFVYGTLKNMMATIELCFAVTFSCLTVFTALAKPLPVWCTLLELAAIVGALIFFIRRLFRGVSKS